MRRRRRPHPLPQPLRENKARGTKDRADIVSSFRLGLGNAHAGEKDCSDALQCARSFWLAHFSAFTSRMDDNAVFFPQRSENMEQDIEGNF